MNKYKWGNMNDPNIIIDHTINRTTRIVKIRDNFRDLAIVFAQEGDTVKAKQLLAKCDELMPLNIFVPGLFDIDYANAYFAVGEMEKGDAFLREVIKVTTQELEFFFSLDKEKRNTCTYDIQLSMETYRRVLRNAMTNQRQKLFEELEPKFNEYMMKYQNAFPEMAQ
jgi:hypothetical protein